MHCTTRKSHRRGPGLNDERACTIILKDSASEIHFLILGSHFVPQTLDAYHTRNGRLSTVLAGIDGPHYVDSDGDLPISE
jgi:hypothetical protein